MTHQTPNGLTDCPAGSTLYFVGIGGISMCGLAEIAIRMGYRVAGSDRQRSEHTEHLAALGARIFIGHEKSHIDETRPLLIIHTAAVHADNPERLRAAELGIPVAERAVFLGWITDRFERVINVAGTHGKTTTTAMCALMLMRAGTDPTIHLGAQLRAFNNSTVRMGEAGKLLVSEACEYTNSYHQFASTTAIILNIDLDHMDFFRDLDDLIQSFAVFTDKIRDPGHLILPHHGAHMLRLIETIRARRRRAARPLPEIITFGAADPEAAEADRLAADRIAYPDAAALWPQRPTVAFARLVYHSGRPAFDVRADGQIPIHIELAVPGRHNVENALAAIAAARLNGASPEACQAVLAHFTGAEGRYTVKGTFNGATVVSDYAHHPAATRATLDAAAHMPHRHIWVVYQPLTFSRVQLFFEQYVDALLPCEHTIFYEIYSDRESDDLGMSSRLIADAVNRRGGSASFAPTYEAILAELRDLAGPGDIVLFLGPEPVRALADRLILEPGGCRSEAAETI